MSSVTVGSGMVSEAHREGHPVITKILICLEGSPSGEAAVRVALAIARECEASVSGLAIVDEPDIRAGAMTGIGGSAYKQARDQTILAAARKQAASWLADFESRCSALGIPAQALEAEGRPLASILEQAQHHELTVIGRDANFRYLTHSEDGETREAVLHRAPRPILIVPESSPRGGLGRVVLIAYDGSGAARRAMLSFAGSGLARYRDVHIATVDEMGETAWKMAHRGQQILRDVGLDPTLHNLVAPRSNAEALFQLAKQIGAGLLVMGAFARSRVAELFSRSTTRGLLESSVVPLYLQH